MNILFVVHQFLPERVGGIEVYIHTLAKSLLALGHRVLVFHGSRQEIGPGEHEGVPTFHTRGTFQGPLRSRLEGEVLLHNPQAEVDFAAVLAKWRPDLVHVHHLAGLSPRIVDLALAHGVPVVTTLHDYWFFCPNAQLLRFDHRLCRGPHLGLDCALCALHRVKAMALAPLAPVIAPFFHARNRTLWWTLERAALVIAPSRFTRKLFLRRGLNPERVVMLGHGIEAPSIPPMREAGDGRLRCIYIGGLAWQKGVHVLIEAFGGLDTDRASLTIYGDENAFPRYSRELHRLARNPNVTFGGPFDHRRLWDILAEADVLVVPSLWYEAASLVISEAFAAGVPVIASGHGALAEKIRDGVDGLLFRPGDAADLRAKIEQLIAEPSLLETLRRNIPPMKTMEEHAQELEAIYRRLAK